MPVEMKPASVIKLNLGLEPDGRVHSFFTNTCYRHMDKYVPRDTGDLRKIVTVTTNAITYEVPYARYQYYGVREDGSHAVNNYTTPGTGPYWDQRMWSVEKEDVMQEVQDYYDRGA